MSKEIQMPKIGWEIANYDKLVQSKAPASVIEQKRISLEQNGVNSEWLDEGLAKQRFLAASVDNQNWRLIYELSLDNPKVYTNPPPKFHNIPLLAEIIASPSLWWTNTKEGIYGAAIKVGGAWVAVTSPAALIQFAPLFPLVPIYNATVPRYKQTLKTIRKRLRPYLQPGPTLRDKIKELERRVIFSVLPGTIPTLIKLVLQTNLFKDYTEVDPTTGLQYKIRGAFRPTQSIRRAVISFCQKRSVGDSIAAETYRRIQSRFRAAFFDPKSKKRKNKHSIAGAIILAVLSDVIIGLIKTAFKRLVVETFKKTKAGRVFSRIFRPLKSLRFLNRGKNIFSIPTLTGAIIGSQFGPLGTIIGGAVGTTFSIYRDLGNWTKVENQALRIEMASYRYQEYASRAGILPELSKWERLRLRLYKPAELFGRYRWLPRSGPTATLIGMLLASTGISPQTAALAGFAWYAWQDLRPWATEKILNKLLVPPKGLGYQRNFAGWLEWMENTHPYRLRALRALRTGGIVGVIAFPLLTVFGVPWQIALGTAIGLGASASGLDFAVRAGHFRFVKTTRLGSLARVGRGLGVIGDVALAVEGLYGAETGTVLGFKRIPFTNISFSGPAGHLTNAAITIGASASIGAFFGGPIGAVIGAAVGTVVYGINELLIKLTGKGLVGWTATGFRALPTASKAGMVIGGVIGFPFGGLAGMAIGSIIGSIAGYIAHLTGIDKIIIAGWNSAKKIPILGSLVKGAGTVGKALLDIISPANKLIDKATELVQKTVSFILAIIGGIIQLLMGEDIATAAVTAALGLLLTGSILTATNTASSFLSQPILSTSQQPFQPTSEFVDVIKTADPVIIKNEELPKTINFKVIIKAKSTKLINISCLDEAVITAKGGIQDTFQTTFNPGDCPKTLEAGEMKTIDFSGYAENTNFFKDSIITNTFTINFDTETPPQTAACGVRLDFAESKTELLKIICGGGSFSGVPGGVIAGILALEGSHVFTYSDEQIAMYSQAGAKDPYISPAAHQSVSRQFGCTVSYAGAVGPMQFLVGKAEELLGYPNGYPPIDTWASYGGAVTEVNYYQFRIPEPCNILDSIYAAAKKLATNCATGGVKCPADEWNQQQVYKAAQAYYGDCSVPVVDTNGDGIKDKTYCQYVWDFYISHKI